jgi:hypothetical protein
MVETEHMPEFVHHDGKPDPWPASRGRPHRCRCRCRGRGLRPAGLPAGCRPGHSRCSGGSRAIASAKMSVQRSFASSTTGASIESLIDRASLPAASEPTAVSHSGCTPADTCTSIFALERDPADRAARRSGRPWPRRPGAPCPARRTARRCAPRCRRTAPPASGPRPGSWTART